MVVAWVRTDGTSYLAVTDWLGIVDVVGHGLGAGRVPNEVSGIDREVFVMCLGMDWMTCCGAELPSRGRGGIPREGRWEISKTEYLKMDGLSDFLVSTIVSAVSKLYIYVLTSLYRKRLVVYFN